MDDHDFVARRPRHEVQPDAECPLVVRLCTSGEVQQGYLADLSRQGLKVVADTELPIDEPVEIEAQLPDRRLPITSAAVIRWVKLQDDGRWSAGVEFDKELAWEVMGELFLSGVLSRDVSCSLRLPDLAP